TTAPEPTRKRAAPVIAAPPHSLRVGTASPRSRAQAKRTTPARKNRTPCVKKGGKDCIENLMPRYVDPQSTYTAAYAATTASIDGFGAPFRPAMDAARASDTDGLLGAPPGRLERKRELRPLLHGAEHDRRARIDNRRNAPQLLFEQAPQRVGVGRADLHQQTVLARDVMDLENVRDFRDELTRPFHTRTFLVAHEGEGEERQPHGSRVDAGRVALDHAALFEFSDPFKNRGRRE